MKTTSNKRYSVTLKRNVEDNIWLAVHDDPKIIDLFEGVDTIPTAFFATAPLDVVVDFMKNHNLSQHRDPYVEYDIIFEGEIQ